MGDKIVVESMLLPCGHVAPAPRGLGSEHRVCEHDGRKWQVQYKGGEYLAREEW